MKTVISKLTNVSTHADGSLTLGFASSKENHTIELKPEVMDQLYVPLLGSRPDDLNSPLSRKIKPVGLRRFRFGNDVGMSFLVGQNVSLHLIMDRSLAAALQKLLETFDDQSTWNVQTPGSGANAVAQVPAPPGDKA
jgi:hypothetical protein